MHARLLALGTAAVIAASGLAGCGGSDDDAATTSTAAAAATATVPDGKLSASPAPIRVGFYAGTDCGKLSDTECEELQTVSKEGYQVFCQGGKAHPEAPASYVWKRKDKTTQEFNYFCFTVTLKDKTYTASNFIYAATDIVKSVHVSADRFPETCDAGWCVQGEWFTTTTAKGRVRNPNSVYANWRAVRIG